MEKWKGIEKFYRRDAEGRRENNSSVFLCASAVEFLP